jgi:predicted DCC family thiol-disulfide oxidoreductase YuxK
MTGVGGGGAPAAPPVAEGAGPRGPDAPILYYDGECGVCTRSVELVLRYDRRGTLRFASLRGEHGAALLRRHPELTGVDSMFWVEPPGVGSERVLVRSEAVLQVARYLGGWWNLAVGLRIVPRLLRDAGYAWFARNRSRFAQARACRLPTPAERSRFLDLA